MIRSALALALVLSGCSETETEERDTPAVAAPIASSECAACGMIVREQPSPRAQLIHRDHTRAFFCSIADMLTYLRAPSPHGEATAFFVEVGDPASLDPLAYDTAPRPWIAAADAHYVVGVERERVMGAPVLVYEHLADAERVAQELDGEVRDFQALRSNPLPEPDPAIP